MKLSDFDYDLPKELIAQRPFKERERCKLMVVDRAAGTVSHRLFSDLTGYFSEGDALVLNDTKVLTCRLIGKRASGGRVELFLLSAKEQGGSTVCEAMISPARVKTGEKVFFDGDIHCTVSDRHAVVFEGMDRQAVYALGQIPLPPYIKRDPDAEDSVYYQTVFAREDGSVAAPTAGLHFTPALLKEISRKGADVAYLTLHVGTATFKPVKTEEIAEHVMGKESYHIPAETLALLAKKRRVCAVGTTACRTLETWGNEGADRGDTGLFIYPGYRFKIVDRLLTNFHLPKTTLFMLVCAFGGTQLLKQAYKQAVEDKYRFYSYGDAMLII
ncbi:MAG: tRNA preQ1(34) S-adenosylmethionine ribosyltransferase-isomerase QueA [Deltaproteobacteria bacterium]